MRWKRGGEGESLQSASKKKEGEKKKQKKKKEEEEVEEEEAEVPLSIKATFKSVMRISRITFERYPRTGGTSEGRSWRRQARAACFRMTLKE